MLILAAVVAVIGNVRPLLDYYGFGSTRDVIRQQTSQAVQTGLTRIDALSLTDRVVIFVVWAFIGVLCFLIIQGIIRIYHEIREEELVASDRYVHPSTFSRGAFWQRVALDFVALVIGLGLLVGCLYGLLVYVVPVGLANTRVFLQGFDPATIGNFLIGLVIIYAWLLIFTTIVKYLFNRHRLIA